MTNTHVSQVNEAVRRWDEAFNAGNAEALAALYAADATLVPPTGTTVVGTASIRDFWSGLFKAGFKQHAITLVSTRQEGTTTIVVGKWQAVGPDEQGADKQYGGQLVNILDAQGRSILHTWN